MLDKRDERIIGHLRKNARRKLTKIASLTGIPVTTVYDRVKGYREKKIIKKHVSLVDFGKLGYHVKAYVALKVGRGDKEKVGEFLMGCGGLNSVYKVDLGYDFLVEVVFEGFKELEDFLEVLEKKFKVEEKKILNVVEELRKEEFLGGEGGGAKDILPYQNIVNDRG